MNKINMLVILLVLGVILLPATALATGLDDVGEPSNPPQVFQGARQLIIDMLGWIRWLIPAGAALMVAYHAFGKVMNTDSGVAADKNRKMKDVLIYAAVGMGAVSIIEFFMSYFA